MRMIERIKYYCAYIVTHWTLTTTFVVAFLAAWCANGFGATHFDLGALATGYGVVAGVSVTKYGINSTLNSPRGERPER